MATPKKTTAKKSAAPRKPAAKSTAMGLNAKAGEAAGVKRKR